MASFESRRLEFGDRLRGLRERAGLTGTELATALGWRQSKVSKIERGRQTPTDTDVVAWLAGLDTPPDTVAELRQQLRDLRIEQVAWRRQLREGHRRRQEQAVRDADAVRVRRGVALMAVPGLLQTPDYARAIFASQADLLGVPVHDIAAAVAARIERQRILYDSTKQIDVLIAESALWYPVSDPAVLAGQFDRLMSLTALPTLRLGVLPAGARLPHLLPHGFWILDDHVLVETVSDELRIEDPDQVAIYRRLLDRLWSVAVEGDQARAVLRAVADRIDE